MEMPGSEYFGAALVAAVESGDVPLPLLDDKVLRVLSAMFERGLFDVPPSGGNPSTNVTSAAHNALARQLGAAGTVLLANPRGVLPLTAATSGTIAVIGDDAHLDPRCCGTGSGALFPPYLITPFEGISARASAFGTGSNTTYFPTPAIAVNITQFYSSTRGDHFLDFSCDECYDLYVAERSEGFAFQSNFSGAVALLLYYNGATSSNLVTTAAYPPSDPAYGYVRVLGYALPLDTTPAPPNTAVLELWTGLDTPDGQPVGSHRDFFTLATDASRAEAQARNYTLVGQLARIATVPGGSPGLAQVVAAAAAADVAVLCVSTPSGEGMDRADLSLSPEDDALVAAVTAAQPNTVVVLHNPGAVVMPWAPAAGAIVAAWFSGQEMGTSLADILFGDVNPSARLPLTFPMTNEDTPLQTPLQYPGVNGTVVYSEGLLMGYRYWDSAGLTPRFPFGHGLSYTTFGYAELVVDTSSAGTAIVINATVTNSGRVAGTEIAQLYLGFPEGWGEPPRLLKGFEALVDLAPGASATASFALAPRDRSIWNVTTYAWQPVPGEFGIFVGASSRDIRLTGSFTV
jgi:beta-glucosidase